MRKKGVMAIDITVLVVLAVIVLAVLIGVIIFGGQKPTGDLAKQTFVRSCCQLNMPLTCTSVLSVACVVPKEFEPSFRCTPADGFPCKKLLTSVADDIGITGAANTKTFCGCG